MTWVRNGPAHPWHALELPKATITVCGFARAPFTEAADRPPNGQRVCTSKACQAAQARIAAVAEEALRRRYRKRDTRPCSSCGRPRSCRWSIDAWVCSCGDEWYPDHDPIVYGDPSEL